MYLKNVLGDSRIIEQQHKIVIRSLLAQATTRENDRNLVRSVISSATCNFT